jgi:hypothetical protein
LRQHLRHVPVKEDLQLIDNIYQRHYHRRWNSPAQAMEGLVRAGPKAVEDYQRAMNKPQKRGPIPGRIEIED